MKCNVRQGFSLSPTLINYIIDLSLGQALQNYPGVQVGANINVCALAYADDIVILSTNYIEMPGLLDGVCRHASAIGMRINASKTRVMSALMPGEQRQAVLLDGEPLEDVDRFKYLGSMFVANGQGTEEIRSEDYSCLFRILSPAFLSLVTASNIVAHKGQDLSGSCALNVNLQLRNLACTSIRRKDVGGL